MDTPSQEFITVEMRGLKAALVAHARAKRTSVSVVVRGAVERELAMDGDGDVADPVGAGGESASVRWVKLSIRVTRLEADRLAAGAKASGLARGAYLVGLANAAPVLASGASRPETIAALVASCAELSTLSRNVHQLTALLSEGDVRRALEYREMLDGLAAEVREHLKQASSALASLRGNGLTVAPADREKQRSRSWRKA
jgi:hypothetical protein